MPKADTHDGATLFLGADFVRIGEQACRTQLVIGVLRRYRWVAVQAPIDKPARFLREADTGSAEFGWHV
jgi:hypothetical protein